MRNLCGTSFQSDQKRTRTPSALPDDQHDIILKHLTDEKLKRKKSKGPAKTAINKNSQWKLTVQGMKEAAYEGQTKRRLIYNDPSSHPLIVMRQSELTFIADYFHDHFSGVLVRGNSPTQCDKCTYVTFENVPILLINPDRKVR